MRLLDLTLPTPEENLALDEALLERLEERGDAAFQTLRFWEASEPFVVVGRGIDAPREVDLDACRECGVPVLRRGSGGGTVVQGPGCLSFALVLLADPRAGLGDVQTTNDTILDRHVEALEPLLGHEVTHRGFTDLARDDMKFSGNAQRRLRRALLFHGTLLHGLDLSLLGRLLRDPVTAPSYRHGRVHAAFVANLDATPDSLRRALCDAWSATTADDAPPFEAAARIASRYTEPKWRCA